MATGDLMAVAGFQCARLAHRLLHAVGGGAVTVLAGHGNNGGDALATARHLAGWGIAVRVVLVGESERLRGLAAVQWRAVVAAEIEAHVAATERAVETRVAGSLGDARLAVDGILGTGARGDPRALEATAIRQLNRARIARVLSIDLPSGLDATSGVAGDPCVVATDTAMLGVAKLGCLVRSAAAVTGTCWLADIGIPAAAFTGLGSPAPIWRDGDWRVVGPR